MKQCPKCNASVGDTAKFCVKCGCNIKKFEEENALGREIFCPECGTKFSGGAFCPECGYNASEALQGNETTSSADTFEDFFADIEESAATAVEDIMTQEEIERQKKALSMFEYEEDGDDTYIVFGIKNKNAIKINSNTQNPSSELCLSVPYLLISRKPLCKLYSITTAKNKITAPKKLYKKNR